MGRKALRQTTRPIVPSSLSPAPGEDVLPFFRRLGVFRVGACLATVALALPSCGSASVPPAPFVASPGCVPASEGATSRTAQLQTVLASAMKTYNLRAVIFSADQNGKPILRIALGRSTPGVPASTAMHFRIGAMGWQYLAQLMLMMSDRKQISLTDPVSKWYPQYPYVQGATLRMLAASSTGFGDYITPPAFANDVEANPLTVWTSDQLVARSLPPYQNPAFTQPGTNWAYSHTGFVMLGSILEQVSGKPYATLLDEMILQPLALHDTQLQFDTNPQLPVLHTLEEGSSRDTTFFNPSFVSWAALTSNVCDLATWTRAFGTGYGLSPASKAEVTAPVNVGLGTNTAQLYFGLGTIVSPPWNEQSAAYWGMYTSNAYDPTTGISLEVTASLNPGSSPASSPSNAILEATSQILTPSHPMRFPN